ncbi:MAG: aspartate aminotransferase family protein [Candidatus Bathyarchaeia archaeon]
MKSEEIIAAEETYGANVYAKRPIIFYKGDKATIWDIEGREYIDCTGSYGSCLIGYCHPRVTRAIVNQAAELSSCHGFAYTQTRAELMKKLVALAPKGLEKVFISNSGAESVECAIKIARKFTKKKEIVAMVGGFHGKTMGALSATWSRRYREAFQPLVPGFKHVPYGNLEKAAEALSSETAAVIVEPIQGESGVKLPPEGYLEGLRELTSKKDILLIMDEVQTGFGRTGKVFASEHWRVTPDILCAAKGIAGGLPIGVTLGRIDVMSCLSRGEHTSTYGGNPIAAAAASATIDIILEENLPQRASELGRKFLKKLEGIKSRLKTVREVRGLGLMLGVESRFDVYDIITGCASKGVLVLDAGRTVIRLLPPLSITEEQVDKASDIMGEVIEEKERAVQPGSAS